MINYNMRYRGPYEYDKFVLNVFQYSNAIYDFENDLNSNELHESTKILENSIDDKLYEMTKEGGFSDKVYKSLILMRGE